MSEAKSYVIPMYALMGFCLTTDDPSTLNDTMKHIVNSVQDSKEVKTILANASRDLTESISAINENTAVIMVPGAFLPVKDKEESKIVVEFVENVNDAIRKTLEEQDKKQIE